MADEVTEGSGTPPAASPPVGGANISESQRRTSWYPSDTDDYVFRWDQVAKDAIVPSKRDCFTELSGALDREGL